MNNLHLAIPPFVRIDRVSIGCAFAWTSKEHDAGILLVVHMTFVCRCIGDKLSPEVRYDRKEECGLETPGYEYTRATSTSSFCQVR